MITLNPADMSRLIKELREKTGAGITACKKALRASAAAPAAASRGRAR